MHTDQGTDLSVCLTETWSRAHRSCAVARESVFLKHAHPRKHMHASGLRAGQGLHFVKQILRDKPANMQPAIQPNSAPITPLPPLEKKERNETAVQKNATLSPENKGINGRREMIK